MKKSKLVLLCLASAMMAACGGNGGAGASGTIHYADSISTQVVEETVRVAIDNCKNAQGYEVADLTAAKAAFDAMMAAADVKFTMAAIETLSSVTELVAVDGETAYGLVEMASSGTTFVTEQVVFGNGDAYVRMPEAGSKFMKTQLSQADAKQVHDGMVQSAVLLGDLIYTQAKDQGTYNAEAGAYECPFGEFKFTADGSPLYMHNYAGQEVAFYDIGATEIAAPTNVM